jgi:type IV pilus assembly protein PilC
MPTYQFEAMDATGQEIKDVIEALNEEEAQATIRQMGYFVTKISVKKSKKTAEKGGAKGKGGKSMALGRVKSKVLCTFTRQLSILQDAGLPILRSLRILEGQCKPGPLKNALIDVCEDIEGGATLSEAMAKTPKAFNRLYVNMIKAGEAGGALEIILQRLAEFMEKSESLKRKVKGAMVYPVVVVLVACAILTFIMIKIVPAFKQIFEDFDTELPAMTQLLIDISTMIVTFWYMIPIVPIVTWLFIKVMRSFKMGRMGWDLFVLKIPVFGMIIEKNTVARTTRTLGTLVASGVPILEALNITRETSGNAMFENMYGTIYDAIREGETIARPMKESSKPPFNIFTLMFWFLFVAGPIGVLLYIMKMRQRVVDDLVVNMVDVGEETGELDTMLYKVADTYDEEVAVLTESLVSLLEPIMVCILGGMVGFIVVALFLPLIKIIETLT